MFLRRIFGRGERIPQLPAVDFEAIAGYAINKGTVEAYAKVDKESAALGAIALSQDTDTGMPTRTLDIPYGSGPAEIEIRGDDVSILAMNAVRRNFTTANEQLLPPEQVNLYLHHRFTQGDALSSKRLAADVKSFRITDADTRINKKAAISFQVQGKERKVKDRKLYTQEERMASFDFTIQYPEVALSVLTYRSLITDYLSELRTVFTGRAYKISTVSLKDFDGFIRQWQTRNFENTLLPALTILHRDAQMQAPEANGKDLIDKALFEQALAFVTSVGGFRNWVTVPANVAKDGVERVNTFLCPAVSAIQGQLGDGDVLAKIYTIINQKADNNDPHVTGMLDTIRAAANRQKHEPLDKEKAAKLLNRMEQNKYMEIVLDGQPTTLYFDGQDFARMAGHYNEGDKILTCDFADDLYSIFRKAMLDVSRTGTPVHFHFNEQDYRVTPDDLQALAAATRQMKQGD